GAEDLLFERELEARLRVSAREVVADRVGQVMEVDDEVADVLRQQRLDGPADERAVADGDERLGKSERHRLEARAEAGGEEHGFHGWPLAVGRWPRVGGPANSQQPTANFTAPPAGRSCSPPSRSACAAPGDTDRRRSAGWPAPCSCPAPRRRCGWSPSALRSRSSRRWE